MSITKTQDVPLPTCTHCLKPIVSGKYRLFFYDGRDYPFHATKCHKQMELDNLMDIPTLFGIITESWKDKFLHQCNNLGIKSIEDTESVIN